MCRHCDSTLALDAQIVFSDGYFQSIHVALLALYGEGGDAGERIRAMGPQKHVGNAATVTLALVVSELAANSVKCGALPRGERQARRIVPRPCGSAPL